MDAPCTVREVRWGDFDDLVRNYYSCYDERDRGEFTGITLFAERPSMPAEADWFARMFRRAQEGAEISLVAEADGHAGGLCTVTPRGVPEHEMGHVGDLGILVGPGYRGRGIGEVLIRAVLERCRPRLEIVVLGVFAQNARARRLYEKVGFRTLGTLPREIKRSGTYLDGLLMYLDLAAAPPAGPSRSRP